MCCLPYYSASQYTVIVWINRNGNDLSVSD